MGALEFILGMVISAWFYMALPLVYVKLRGKVAKGKAFMLALLNFFLVKIILSMVFMAFGFESANSLDFFLGATLWLFVASRYMTDKKGL
jgi:hypothetical protein